MSSLRIAIAQLNLIAGDITYNLDQHLNAAHQARDELVADLVIFPELSLTHYTSEDLFLRPSFIVEADIALKTCVEKIKGIYALIGHPYYHKHKLYNACSLIYDGKILATYCKQALPNYGVFDECRYFTPGKQSVVVDIKGIPTALLICEDIWRAKPCKDTAKLGAKLILIPNASPFEIDKHEKRIALLKKRAEENHVNILYCNIVGGQDDLIFDGGSFTTNAKGELTHLLPFCEEAIQTVEFNLNNGFISPHIIPAANTLENIYHVLVLGLKDYITKNNFKSVIVGASGGIDSALTLAIAVDALGKDKVEAVMMPSRYTQEISDIDAIQLCDALEIQYQSISIEPAYQAFLASLKNNFADKQRDVTEENMQARCRAVILMALANKHNHLVITTGNRSELAVGYCTLYGDMAGAYAPLKDVPKTLVYELARYRNTISQVIPERSITRAPTAELSENQKDQDSLPPYEILDAILFAYINQELSIAEIIAKGFDAEVVAKIIKMVKRNEYKRKQAAIGPHIQHKSFGRDYRYPLTNGYKG